MRLLDSKGYKQHIELFGVVQFSYYLRRGRCLLLWACRPGCQGQE